MRVLKEEAQLHDMPRSVLLTSIRKKQKPSLPALHILLSSVSCQAFRKHSMQFFRALHETGLLPCIPDKLPA